MKNLILPIIIVLAFIIGVNAGTRNSRQERTNIEDNIILANHIDADTETLLTIDEIKANVNLSDSQAVAIDSILTNASTKLQGVTDTEDSGQQAKTQIIDDAYSAIRNILTEDQRIKFDALAGQKRSNQDVPKG